VFFLENFLVRAACCGKSEMYVATTPPPPPPPTSSHGVPRPSSLVISHASVIFFAVLLGAPVCLPALCSVAVVAVVAAVDDHAPYTGLSHRHQGLGLEFGALVLARRASSCEGRSPRRPLAPVPPTCALFLPA
jgi:hypothetical protein